MKKCILCNQMTEGSIGAAGIKWSCICQPCIDKEDKALLNRVAAEVKAIDMVFNSIMEHKHTIHK